MVGMGTHRSHRTERHNGSVGPLVDVGTGFQCHSVIRAGSGGARRFPVVGTRPSGRHGISCSLYGASPRADGTALLLDSWTQKRCAPVFGRHVSGYHRLADLGTV